MSKAFEQGYKAFYDGIKGNQNPYDTRAYTHTAHKMIYESDDYKNWNGGWEYAKENMPQIKPD